MKNRIYANRGQPFEDLLRFANDRYAAKHLASITKVPTEFIPLRDRSGKIVSAKVEHKSIVDFLGRYRGHPIAIEAKHTSDNSIRFDAVQPHQADYMDTFTEQPGTIGIVAVSFDSKRYFAIPWAFWQAAYNARVRPRAEIKAPASVSAFGCTWDIPQKKSVRVDEIPPVFEIPPHDFTFGLHYLKNAELYVIPEPAGGETNHG